MFHVKHLIINKYLLRIRKIQAQTGMKCEIMTQIRTDKRRCTQMCHGYLYFIICALSVKIRALSVKIRAHLWFHSLFHVKHINLNDMLFDTDTRR